MGSILLFFLVSRGKTKKTKKTKWQNLCPSVCHGVSTFGFLVFRGKTKKNKMAEPMSQCLAWGQYFCFFLVFWFFEVKPKEPKKTKWQNLCPSVWHGVSTFVFLGFCFFEVKPKKQKKQNGRTYVPVSGMGSVLLFFCFFWFFEVFAIFWYLKWVLPFCFFGFSRFVQYSAFPNKTLVSFPKKTFFSQ